MSCWIKCPCRVYVCLGAMLPAVWGGIGVFVCVQLGACRPASALVVSGWPEQAKTQYLGFHALLPIADAALHRAVCLSALWLQTFREVLAVGQWWDCFAAHLKLHVLGAQELCPREAGAQGRVCSTSGCSAYDLVRCIFCTKQNTFSNICKQETSVAK